MKGFYFLPDLKLLTDKKNSSERVKQLLGLNYEYPKIMDKSKSVNQIGIGYKAK